MKRFAKAIALFSAGSVIGTLTQVAKGKLGAVLLGPEGTGVLNQLTNAWNLLYSLAGLGFYNGIVRRIAEARSTDDREALVRQLSTSLIFLTVVASLGATASVALAQPISNALFADGGQHASLVAITLISVPLAIMAQTYRGLLSGCQLVRPIVTAQVVSDVLGLALFVILVLRLNLFGAALAFSGLQLLKLMLQIATVRRALPGTAILPRAATFSWREVGTNAGYGINGLFMVAVGVLTIVIVSRWIIASRGLGANGIFSVAWKVSSVYFGAIYSSASSFYFPSLVACRDEDLQARINEAISLYFYLLPPLIITLMALGDDLMALLFSAEFGPAAALLLLLLPGDLFRVLAEAMGMAFLARRRLLAYTLTYVLWASAFLALSGILLPRYALMGVAGAYLASQALSAAAVYLCARHTFSFKFAGPSLRAMAAGILAVALAAGALSQAPAPLWRYALGAAVLAIWFGLAWTDPRFRDLAAQGWARLLRRRAVLP
ncbi:oligosaccharide flippase family protein [Tahibacter sp.]|uniref:oligosaccharide flippase family protein n=1 Tax=Tahibacter sp. TaxID=2056211 RepID=UPI0028C3B556|nr:oligosaccharide flippase family protein [Tahibacter sp.]